VFEKKHSFKDFFPLLGKKLYIIGGVLLPFQRQRINRIGGYAGTSSQDFGSCMEKYITHGNPNPTIKWSVSYA